MTKIYEQPTQPSKERDNGDGGTRGYIDVDRIRPGLRVESIDLLRGIVMIIMAIDHVRDYFHFDAFLYSPEDISQTSAALFMTRWITHLCAPTFIFLSGVSAFFVAQKKNLWDTSVFLLTRGIWLVLLQLTLIRFAWNFDPLFHYNSNTIISTIGFCMITLAVLIYLPVKTIFIIGLAMVFGHNFLDGLSFQHGSAEDIVWSFLHVPKSFDVGDGYSFTFLYPIIPWVGVMALGYCFGALYRGYYTAAERREVFLQLGLLCLLIFMTLRISNVYGDPVPWSLHSEMGDTIMSFFNLQKYPPSLLYLSITLGISLLLLSTMEGKNLKRWAPVTLVGNVALFYYVVHIFLIHLLAVIAAILTGHPAKAMIFTGSIPKGNSWLNGSYGFSLWGVYFVWIVVIVLLYPLCLYWHSFKIRNKKKWWVSYV